MGSFAEDVMNWGKLRRLLEEELEIQPVEAYVYGGDRQIYKITNPRIAKIYPYLEIGVVKSRRDGYHAYAYLLNDKKQVAKTLVFEYADSEEEACQILYGRLKASIKYSTFLRDLLKTKEEKREELSLDRWIETRKRQATLTDYFMLLAPIMLLFLIRKK